MPQISSPIMIELTIIVPAYNEEKRITPFLTSLLSYISKHPSYEVIVVNDGSKDKTEEVVRNLIIHNKNQAHLVSYKKNKGKGGAIKTGMRYTQADYILFIDADGSISPEEIDNMFPLLKKYDVVVGSRRIKGANVKADLIRDVLGWFFNVYVNMLYGIKIEDNLCGFKGFKKKVMEDLFKKLYTQGWVFDVELFYKIRKKKYSLYKLPIKWEHREGGNIKFFTPFKMAFDLLILRVKLLSWNLRKNKTKRTTKN